MPCAAVFGYAPQAVNVVLPGQNIPYGNIVCNTSERCRGRHIELKIGTGDIYIRDAGLYAISVLVDVPPAVGQYVTIDTGNGLSVDVSLYNGTGGNTVFLPVRANSVLKVVVRGLAAGITFTPGTNTSIPLSTIAIAKVNK